ncbi:hypothetical protein JYK22_05200, partial [Nonomuraea sp. RK-328]|nr:hypothetical protein [Nonomuraea sp. RK-328]
MRRWPLLLLALPAGVATWSGWVGLGEKTGFGVVKLLPGLSEVEINTAITLPIGVEAYAAFALSAWLNTTARLSEGTRRFAKWSALGSLLLGCLGQVAYHLLETYGLAKAPAWVTTVVSCLPVLVLGMGAALGHMLSRDAEETVPEPSTPVPDPEPDVPEDDPDPDVDPEAVSAVERLIAWTHRVGGALPEVSGTAEVRVPEGVPEADPVCTSAAQHYAVMLSAGQVPSLRSIKRELRIGQDKAVQVRAYLTSLAGARGESRALEVAR